MVEPIRVGVVKLGRAARFGFYRRVRAHTKSLFLLLVLLTTSIAIVLLLASSNPTRNIITVNLNQKTGIPLVPQINEIPGDFLRVAITGVLSPMKTLEQYQGLLAFMERTLGRRVTLILKPSYTEINDLIRGGQADVAFVCSLPYVKGNEEFGMQLLVAPQMYGKTTYYSYLIVSKESRATSLGDLRGTRFAFADPISNSGSLAPNYQLYLLGETLASFFSQYIYTYSHDNSIIAVADKLVDGAAVDSLVYEQMAAANAEIAAKTKVIARWGPYGIPPVVVSPTIAPGLKQQLQDFFLNLHRSAEGAQILKSLDIDQFVVVPDSIYDPVREMKTKLGW